MRDGWATVDKEPCIDAGHIDAGHIGAGHIGEKRMSVHLGRPSAVQRVHDQNDVEASNTYNESVANSPSSVLLVSLLFIYLVGCCEYIRIHSGCGHQP